MPITEPHKILRKSKYYNIHNILKIKSDLDLGYDYFLSEIPLSDIDLVIKIGELKENSHCYQRLSSGIFYSEEKDEIFSDISLFGKRISWGIKKLMSKETELVLSKSYVFLSRYFLMVPISSVHNIIGLVRILIQIKLLLKKHMFLIGSCASTDNELIVFTGSSGSGKTLSITEYLKVYSGSFMADDFFIINESSTFSFPTKLKFRKRNLDFLSYSKFIDPDTLFDSVINKVDINSGTINFLELSNKKFKKEISFDMAVEKLYALNNRAIGFSNERILSFLPYMYNDFSLKITQIQKSIFRSRFKNFKFYVLSTSNAFEFMELI